MKNGIILSCLIPAALLAACAAPLSSRGEGNLRVVLAGNASQGGGGGPSRAVIDPPEAVSYYYLDFSGPGGETHNETLLSGTEDLALTLTLILGQWTISAEAFTADRVPYGRGETTVTVEAGKPNEAQIPMKRINRPPGFTIEGPQDELIGITITHSAGAEPATDISWSGDESITFTVDGSGYTVEDGTLRWIINESEILAGGGNSLVIRARDYAQRSYTVTVMLKAEGQWYSRELPFKVTE